MGERLMRLKEVLEIIPVSKRNFYYGMEEGRFPKPVRLGPRTVAWKASDIEKIIKEGVKQTHTEKTKQD